MGWCPSGRKLKETLRSRKDRTNDVRLRQHTSTWENQQIFQHPMNAEELSNPLLRWLSITRVPALWPPLLSEVCPRATLPWSPAWSPRPPTAGGCCRWCTWAVRGCDRGQSRCPATGRSIHADPPCPEETERFTALYCKIFMCLSHLFTVKYQTTEFELVNKKIQQSKNIKSDSKASFSF